MKIFMYIILGLISIIILISAAWRFSSRRLALPCPVWLSWLVELDNPFTKTNRAHVIIDYLELELGMKILDAGCGPGRLTIPVAQKIGPQGEVVAMDMQAGMLDRVKEKAQAADLHNIRLMQARLGDDTLEHDHYDRALLVTVLGEIPDREAALKELFDALKTGGILSITEIIFDPHFQAKETVLRLAKTIGFQQKKFIGNRFAYIMHLQKP